MWRYLATRLAALVGVLFAVAVVTFVLGRVLPGDTAAARLGPQATPAQLDALRHKMGLDRPLVVQFGHWSGGVLHGDFGTSAVTGQPVSATLSARVPVSLELVVLAELLALLVAVPAAIFLAWHRDGWLDRLANKLAFVALSVPQFAVAIALIVIFAVHLHWFPASGYTRFSDDPLRNLRSLILPAAALATGLAARCFRILRGEVATSLREDYIRTARATGRRPVQVLLHDALIASVLPLLTLVGLDFGLLLGGAVIVEQLFGVPGLGSFLMDAVANRDFPSLQAGVVVIATGYVLAGFVVELLHAVIDPRIRHA